MSKYSTKENTTCLHLRSYPVPNTHVEGVCVWVKVLSCLFLCLQCIVLPAWAWACSTKLFFFSFFHIFSCILFCKANNELKITRNTNTFSDGMLFSHVSDGNVHHFVFTVAWKKIFEKSEQNEIENKYQNSFDDVIFISHFGLYSLAGIQNDCRSTSKYRVQFNENFFHLVWTDQFHSFSLFLFVSLTLFR